MKFRTFLLIVVFVATYAFALWIVLSTIYPAGAHEWYSADCCGGEDCFQLADGDVKETPNGWYIQSLHFLLPYDSPKVRQSRDGHFHACTPGGSQESVPYQRLYCLYVPGLGV